MSPSFALTWGRWILYVSPHYISIRLTLILHSQLLLGHTNDLFPSHFPTRTLFAHHVSHVCAIWPTHPILHDNTLTVRCTIQGDYHCAQNHSNPKTKVSATGNTQRKNLPFVFISHFHCRWVGTRQTRLGMSTAIFPSTTMVSFLL